MHRLEIIHLRLAGRPTPGLVAGLLQALDTADESHPVRIYRHASIPGDLSIHLRTGSSAPEDHRALVAHLVGALQEHGLVEHTVWIEETGQTIGEAP